MRTVGVCAQKKESDSSEAIAYKAKISELEEVNAELKKENKSLKAANTKLTKQTEGSNSQE